MSGLTLTLTRIGLERFTAAQLGEDIDLSISGVGLTNAAFVSAPTLEALPGEFKRLASISGDQVGDNTVHLMIRDESADDYSARGFGLFLADGTLLATYGQADRLFEKSPRATLLAAVDITFPAGDISELTFGDTNFLNPPGTSERKGVVRFATAAEAAVGTSTDTAVTPAALRRALPIGAIIIWYGDAAGVPAGWAICDGRQVARSDGLGPIVTPNMRDRAVVGAGQHAPGTPFGAAQASTSQGGAHGHQVEVSGNTGNSPAATSLTTTRKTDTASGGSQPTIQTVEVVDPGHIHTASLVGTAAQAGAHQHVVDVTPPSFAVLFIMKV